jgi:hypothetical protein
MRFYAFVTQRRSLPGCYLSFAPGWVAPIRWLISTERVDDLLREGGLFTPKNAPYIDYDIKYLLFNMQIVTLEWQLFIESLSPSLRYLSAEKRKQLSNNRNLSKMYNKEMIKALQRKIADAYNDGV